MTVLADYSYLGLNTFVAVDEPQPGLTYTLLGLTPGTDPLTGDIYQGFDLFGQIKDLIWTSAGGSSSSSSSSCSSGTPNVVERIQHGYDRAGNRLWRKELADPGASHDELYVYDGIYRLKDMQRGTLSANQTAVSPMTFAQCWGLDATGNWQSFREDDTGSGAWDLVQQRSANSVNEITEINNDLGSTWVTPAYDAAGNMTTMPQPGSPGSPFAGTYDAWHRLMTLSSSGSQVAGYQYDGRNWRTLKNLYTAGTITSTRDFFYSSDWQSIEERLGTIATPDRQFVWGIRYIDDLVLRDRDANGVGVLTERFFSFQDPNWNVIGIVDSTGTVQERYAYDAYGNPAVLTFAFGLRLGTLWDWETRYAGYWWDETTNLYSARSRNLCPILGTWVSPEAIMQPRIARTRYQYVECRPLSYTDPYGQKSSRRYDVWKNFVIWYNANLDRSWLKPLPACPCSIVGLRWELRGCRDSTRFELIHGIVNPEPGVWENPTWIWLSLARTFKRIDYHPGATYDMRSVPKPEYGGAGQQCTYDASGKLITHGPGAGTADKISPVSDRPGHMREDVDPFEWALELDGGTPGEFVEQYIKLRPADAKNHCDPNP